MELIVMIVCSVPDRLLHQEPHHRIYITFIAVHGFAFTFQTLMLIIEWVGGSKAAFGPYPKADEAQVWSYAAVNLLIFVVGLGLVLLGQRVAARRHLGARVDLDAN